MKSRENHVVRGHMISYETDFAGFSRFNQPSNSQSIFALILHHHSSRLIDIHHSYHIIKELIAVPINLNHDIVSIVENLKKIRRQTLKKSLIFHIACQVIS